MMSYLYFSSEPLILNQSSFHPCLGDSMAFFNALTNCIVIIINLRLQASAPIVIPSESSTAVEVCLFLSKVRGRWGGWESRLYKGPTPRVTQVAIKHTIYLPVYLSTIPPAWLFGTVWPRSWRIALICIAYKIISYRYIKTIEAIRTDHSFE